MTLSRFSQRLFSFVALWVIILAGCEMSRDGRSVTGKMPSGAGYVGMWNACDELQHLVIEPQYAQSTVIAISGPSPDHPQPDSICSYSDGLYLNCTQVDLSKARIFVFTKDQKMVPINLSEAELELFVPEAMDNVSNLPVWHEKIRPVVDAESKRWKERNFSVSLETQSD